MSVDFTLSLGPRAGGSRGGVTKILINDRFTLLTLVTRDHIILSIFFTRFLSFSHVKV